MNNVKLPGTKIKTFWKNHRDTIIKDMVKYQGVVSTMLEWERTHPDEARRIWREMDRERNEKKYKEALDYVSK